MSVLTVETKAKKVREAFGTLAGEYITEGQMIKSMAIQKAMTVLDPFNESLAKLYDILTGDK